MNIARIWGRHVSLFLLFVAFVCGVNALAQSTSGSVNGSVTDATTAIVPGAKVTLSNAVSGYTRSATTDATGQFHFYNVPFNPYRITVSSAGFQTLERNVQVSSSVA